MQQLSRNDTVALLERMVAEAIPNRLGLQAWQAFLRAHATLMRQLATDLVEEVGLTLGDFDVLAQLAGAGGELRMSDLAAQAYSSRSGMTRRVDRLVAEGLVSRATTDSDGRGVVVTLTDAGLARLGQATPAHARGVAQLFVSKLTDEELSVLTTALRKVAVDCGFG